MPDPNHYPVDVMVYSLPTGQVVPTSDQVVDSTCECSGVSTTDFYQLSGSVQLQLLNECLCTPKLPLSRNPPLLERQHVFLCIILTYFLCETLKLRTARHLRVSDVICTVMHVAR